MSITGTLASTIGQTNPIRYRGYYYDNETGFYYCQSRYYDPEIGRWINADGQMSGVGGDIRGYNQYSYCFNNPINLDDSTGNWPKWVKKAAAAVKNTVKKVVDKVVETVKTVVNKAKTVYKNVSADISNFNIKNESEQVVLDSNYISAYKGTVVVKTDLERSGSFGVLFISNDVTQRKAPEDEIRHEYGHTKQLEQLGVIKYTFCIGLPSLFEWGSDSEYYRRPWEITADIYGGVESRNYPGYEAAGYEYLQNSKDWGILVWFTID